MLLVPRSWEQTKKDSDKYNKIAQQALSKRRNLSFFLEYQKEKNEEGDRSQRNACTSRRLSTSDRTLQQGSSTIDFQSGNERRSERRRILNSNWLSSEETPLYCPKGLSSPFSLCKFGSRKLFFRNLEDGSSNSRRRRRKRERRSIAAHDNGLSHIQESEEDCYSLCGSFSS